MEDSGLIGENGQDGVIDDLIKDLLKQHEEMRAEAVK